MFVDYLICLIINPVSSVADLLEFPLIIWSAADSISCFSGLVCFCVSLFFFKNISDFVISMGTCKGGETGVCAEHDIDFDGISPHNCTIFL